jgi:hypothetical protein
MINSLESIFPGTKQSIMQGFEKIAEMPGGKGGQIELGSCRDCKEPCVKDLCKACELLRSLKG